MVRIILLVALVCGSGCGNLSVDPPRRNQSQDPKVPPAAGLFLPVRG